MRKPFSRALYEAYDQKAKDALESYLISQGHTILRTEENYGVDIVSYKGGSIYYSEAEVKVAWDKDWPEHWEEVRIPERKTRLLNKYSDKSGYLNFYIFNKHLDKAWRIKDSLLTQDSLREAKGRNIRKGELFYHIPYTSAELINMRI